MKLSTKARYGARAMLDLAIHYGQGPIQLKDIAERQEISEKYLEHLITSLKVAGFVKSVRGAHGGYLLSRPPSEIRLFDIIRVLEGSLAPVDCVDDSKICHRASFCVTRDVWGQIKEVMTGVLESITLEEMCQRQKRKQEPEVMYYI